MSINMRDSQTPDSENTTPQNLENCTVVNEVTVEMILNDLAQGRNKEKIRQKYAFNDENGNLQPFEKWMVDEMFKDPSLRGKKPARKKVLPFTFKGTPPVSSTMGPDLPPNPPTEPKYGIPGTEGGHQFDPSTQNNGYVEVIHEEIDNNNLENNN